MTDIVITGAAMIGVIGIGGGRTRTSEDAGR